jgi:hypothetical protein
MFKYLLQYIQYKSLSIIILVNINTVRCIDLYLFKVKVMNECR